MRRPDVAYRTGTACQMAIWAKDAFLCEGELSDKYSRVWHSFIDEPLTVTGDTPEKEAKIFDVQGYILGTSDPRVDHMTLAFRGGEPDKILNGEYADLLTMWMYKLNEFHWGDFVEDGWQWLAKPKTHEGFTCAYGLVKSHVEEAIEEIAPRQISITGHSMGGAIAVVAAVDIQCRHPECFVSMYNFGSPRVGNFWFAQLCNKVLRNSHRVVMAGDFVAHLPMCWMGGYYHISKEHTLEKHPDIGDIHHANPELYLEQCTVEHESWLQNRKGER